LTNTRRNGDLKFVHFTLKLDSQPLKSYMYSSSVSCTFWFVRVHVYQSNLGFTSLYTESKPVEF